MGGWVVFSTMALLPGGVNEKILFYGTTVDMAMCVKVDAQVPMERNDGTNGTSQLHNVLSRGPRAPSNFPYDL